MQLVETEEAIQDPPSSNISGYQFKLMVEAAPNAMFMVDDQWVIIYANKHAERVFGYSKEELYGKTLDVLVPERNRADHIQSRNEFMNGLQSRMTGSNREVYGLRKDGQVIPIEVGLNPVKNENRIFVVISVADMSDRAILTETLVKLRETQAQLVQRERLASLGSLVAGIAHEINTPVGIAVTAISFLKEEIVNLKAARERGSLNKAQFDRFMDDCYESVDILSTNIERAAALIRSFKRVAVDQSSEERRSVNLREYIDALLLSLSPKLKGTSHRVEVEGDKQIVIDTMPGALSQVITNLVLNSLIHAFPAGRAGVIKIKVTREDGVVTIRHEDDGSGIDPTNLPRIFDPFFTTLRGRGGSGLGLHVVFNTVHQSLKGAIRVRSQVGKGTEFIITLPDMIGRDSNHRLSMP